MILLFGISFLGGLLSTIPPGPLNLRLIFLHLQDQKKLLLIFQLGILLTDASLSVVAFYLSIKTKSFLNILIYYKDNLILLGEITFIFLLLCLSVFHFYSYFKKKNHNQFTSLIQSSQVCTSQSTNKLGMIVTFLSGIVGTLTIPGLVPFWYFWWIGSYKFFISTQSIFSEMVLVFIGVILGDSLVFASYRCLAEFFYKRNKDSFLLINLEFIVGIVFLVVAIFFLVSLIV